MGDIAGGPVQALLDAFGLGDSRVQPVQMETGKAVWRVESPGGLLCIKECHHDRGRMIFALGGQEHAHQRGAPVPAVRRTRSGDLLVQEGGRLFSALGWVQGRRPRPGRRDDLAAMVRALARFHRLSRGYRPPEGATVSSKWGRWPHHYSTMCRQMEECRGWAERRLGTHARAVLPLFAEQVAAGQQGLERLGHSPYGALVAQPAEVAPLNHQDFGPGNAVITPRGAFVIDLDGVTYDLPARDLRKVAYKMCEGSGWQPAALRELLSWYEGEAELSPEERECLLVDLYFPHGFHAAVKDLRKHPVGVPVITRAALREREKLAALAELMPWIRGR